MSQRLHVNHYAEAERCLSQASHRVAPEGYFRDPQTSQLLISQAQVHATLAALPDQLGIANESAKESWAEREAFRKVIVGHVFEMLMSDSPQVRRCAQSIGSELDTAGVNIDMDIWDRSVEAGHGPHHHTVDGVVYPLLKQFTDCTDITWEHSGDWASGEVPVMVAPDLLVPMPPMPLPELARTRGPLTERENPEVPF